MTRTDEFKRYSKGRQVLIAALITAFAFGWGWIGLQSSYADDTKEVAYINDAGVENWIQASPDLHGGALDAAFSRWFVVDKTTTIDNRMEARGGGDIHLIVEDGKTLNANDGIRVAGDTRLHIYGQKGQTGTINATARNNSAGIGGNHRNAGGEIEINGCVIKATGGKSSAGIGGTEDLSGGKITINGGRIDAQGGEYAAGIGGGEAAHGPGIEINGGGVLATGGDKGAGIGGGHKASAGSILVRDGMAHGIGGEYAAGIGSGYKGDGGSLRFEGGQSIGQGSEGGAGIGSGNRGDDVNIYITGGKVTGEGNYELGKSFLGDKIYKPGAGIGGGYKGRAGEIRISGGTVYGMRGHVGSYPIGHGGDVKEGNGKFHLDYAGASVFVSGIGYNLWDRVPTNEREDAAFSAYSARYSGQTFATVRIEPCDHPGEWKSDESEHWKSCEFCNEAGRLNKAAHTYEWKSEGDKHWQRCTVCGYETEKKDHAINSGGDKCRDCGAPMSRIKFENSSNGEKKDGPAFERNRSYTLPTPEKAGFEQPEGLKFAGWRINGGTILYEPGTALQIITAETLVTAVWSQSWSGFNASLQKDGAVIKLESDIISESGDEPLRIPLGHTVTLDLNGHEIHRVLKGSKSEGEVIFVDTGGHLILNDSSGGKGVISGGESYENGDADTGGGIVVRGSVTMNGGTIKGNHSTGNMGGGGVSVPGGRFIMNGGRITGNTAVRGGGIFATSHGTVILKGGSIDSNYATVGAGIYLAPSSSESSRCLIRATGSPKVKNNRVLTGQESNLWLPDYAKIQVWDTPDTTATLKADARIGISLESKPPAGGRIITEEFPRNKGALASFSSDDPSIGIGVNKAGEVILGSSTAKLTLEEPAEAAAQAAGAGEVQDSALQAAGAGEVQDTITVVKGQSYILPSCTIRPKDGKVFDKWLIDGKTYEKGDEVTVSRDTQAVPVWRDRTEGMERILLSAGEHGAVYASHEEAAPGNPDDPDDMVYILALPENGYRLAEWKVKKGGVTLDNGDDEFTFFRMGSSEVEIHAEFEPILVTDLELSQNEIVLKEGESMKLSAIVTPVDALDGALTWDIAPELAIVKEDTPGNAVLKAEKAGVAELLVHTAGEGEHLFSVVRDVRIEHKKLKHVLAKAPTESADGNIEYWYCDICKKYYRESEGVLEISKAETVVKMTDKDEIYRTRIEKASKVKTKIKSVKAGKKGKAVVKWKAVKGVTGYRICYSTDKKFKKGVKTRNVAKAKSKSVTLKKLKKGKKYYVKVIAYTKVKGSVTGRTVYGKVSKAKTVRAR